MSEKLDAKAVVLAWNERYRRQDIAGALEFMAPDFVRLGDTTNFQPIGRDRWAAGQVGFFPSFPDWTWHLQSIVVDGDHVVCEFVEEATFTNRYTLVSGLQFEPTGEKYLDHSSIHFRVNDDGLIAEIRAYYTNDLERKFHIRQTIEEKLGLEGLTAVNPQ
jgi:predicted ester cyclase